MAGTSAQFLPSVITMGFNKYKICQFVDLLMQRPCLSWTCGVISWWASMLMTDLISPFRHDCIWSLEPANNRFLIINAHRLGKCLPTLQIPIALCSAWWWSTALQTLLPCAVWLLTLTNGDRSSQLPGNLVLRQIQTDAAVTQSNNSVQNHSSSYHSWADQLR